MQTRILGRTNLQISRLGIGLSEIGYQLTPADVDQARSLLNRALDNGINFLDTAACYDISEELVGQTVSQRRDEFVLATKAGHAAGDYQGESWTAQTVSDSIDRSLKRMRTDYVDLVQLHSCDVEILERGEVIEALQAAQQAGKTRFIGYSGDNDAAMWAVQSGYFDTLQTSFNLTEQKARYELLPAAKQQNMGIIIKRPIANGAWGKGKSPSAYANIYWDRYQQMAANGPLPEAPDNSILLALGFTFAHDEVDTAIVGTKNPDHLLANIRWVGENLPISAAAVNELHARFDLLGAEWFQQT